MTVVNSVLSRSNAWLMEDDLETKEKSLTKLLDLVDVTLFDNSQYQSDFSLVEENLSKFWNYFHFFKAFFLPKISLKSGTSKHKSGIKRKIDLSNAYKRI